MKKPVDFYRAASGWAENFILKMTPDSALGENAVVLKYARLALRDADTYLSWVNRADATLSVAEKYIPNKSTYGESPAVSRYAELFAETKDKYVIAIGALRQNLATASEKRSAFGGGLWNQKPADEARLNSLNEVRLSQEAISRLLGGKVSAMCGAMEIYETDRDVVLGRKSASPMRQKREANFHEVMVDVTPGMDLPVWHQSIGALSSGASHSLKLAHK